MASELSVRQIIARMHGKNVYKSDCNVWWSILPAVYFFWSNPKKQSIVSIINENITLTFLSRYHKNFIEFSVYRKIYVKNEMKQIQ